MKITIPEAVSAMLIIVDNLKESFPKKKFTLDGRLVGDIGEILVEAKYDVNLFEDVKKHHDGTCSDGRQVQIKATMKKHVTFPADHIPDYFIAIQLHMDGNFVEVFNGPGRIASEAIKNRKVPKTNLHSISVSSLKRLKNKVDAVDRIPERAK